MSTHLVDTNIIIRLVTNDIPELADHAAAQLDALASDSVELPLYVLAEAVYVLALNENYSYSRTLVQTALQAIIAIPQFSLDHKVAYAALNFFAAEKLDFVDCLLLAQHQTNNQILLTFDKPLKSKLT